MGLCSHPDQLSLQVPGLAPAWGEQVVESRLRAVLVPFSSWQLQKVLSWMCPGMAWQGLTILWGCLGAFPSWPQPASLEEARAPSMVPLHQAAELQGGLRALGKGCSFFKQYSRELFMWHLGSPKLLLLSPVKVPVPSHRCVCKECACSRPAP